MGTSSEVATHSGCARTSSSGTGLRVSFRFRTQLVIVFGYEILSTHEHAKMASSERLALRRGIESSKSSARSYLLYRVLRWGAARAAA
jgi:hypothetical protein